MSVWLVTGGSGFLGRHLLSTLLANFPADSTIIPVGRRKPDGWPRDSYLCLDLEDRNELIKTLQTLNPQGIFHLAGKTPPGTAEAFERFNSQLTAQLVEIMVRLRRKARLIAVGSAAELGSVPVESLPVSESYRCDPAEPYGQSKWRATQAVLAAEPPIEAVVARIFNPIGPGLPQAQALGRFASELATGEGPLHLTVGDLDARRDFVDVRDVASALVQLAVRGRPGEVYHLGTSVSHTVREGLDQLVRLSGRDVTIAVDPDRASSRGPADSRADIRKIGEHVGWSPRISWAQSLHDLWVDARDRARAGLTDPSPPV